MQPEETLTVAKQSKGELVVPGFIYGLLEPDVAGQIRSRATRIREQVRRTLEGIIEVGKELLAVKAALAHGQIGAWLDSEFGWTERTARNCMAVADQFGPKTEIISDLRLVPTAAYLLAAPSTPETACLTAIERVTAGEKITPGNRGQGRHHRNILDGLELCHFLGKRAARPMSLCTSNMIIGSPR
jgi:Protein of unknown function (DUF3102)